MLSQSGGPISQDIDGDRSRRPGLDRTSRLDPADLSAVLDVLIGWRADSGQARHVSLETLTIAQGRLQPHRCSPRAGVAHGTPELRPVSRLRDRLQVSWNGWDQFRDGWVDRSRPLQHGIGCSGMHHVQDDHDGVEELCHGKGLRDERNTGQLRRPPDWISSCCRATAERRQRAGEMLGWLLLSGFAAPPAAFATSGSGHVCPVGMGFAHAGT